MPRLLIIASFTLASVFSAVTLAQETPPPKVKTQPKAEAPKAKTEAPRTKTEAPKDEPEELPPKAVKDQASYAIGLNFGKNLAQGIKQDNADVDIDLLLQGLKDALTNAKPKYTDEQMRIAMEAFGKELEARAKGLADRNKKEGESFLAENKKKKDVQTTPTGLQYKILKKGEGKSPQKTDTVKVHYHGTLIDGTVFDSSVKRKEPIEFPVTGVIKGWTEALLKMKVGDKWILYVPSELAYGPVRQSAEIGPNQLLIFEVELLEIVE